MKIKSIFYYLSSFTSNEWKTFQNIIQKEYGHRPEIVQLVKKASRKRKQLKAPLTGDISRRLFEELYQKKNYPKYLDILEKRIEQFFKDQVALRNELLLDRIQTLLKFSNRKGLEDFFLKEVRAFEIEMSKQVYLTKEHYFALHLLNSKAHFLHHAAKEKHNFHKYLWRSDYYLKVYHLFYAIKAHVESHFLHQVYKVASNLEIRYDTDRLIQQAKYHPQNPLLQLYFNILIGVYESFSLKDFEYLGAQFEHIASHIPEQERVDLVSFIMNLAAKQINRGNAAYRVPCLKFYLNWTQAGLLFVNGLFSNETYLSVVDLAVNLKAFKDLEQFKHNVEDRLSISRRDQLIRIATLIEYFHKGWYRKCIALYQQQSIPSEPSLRIRVRLLLLRSYFMIALESKAKNQFLLEAERFRSYCNYSRKEDMGEDRKKLIANLREQLMSVFQTYVSGGRKLNPVQKETLRKTIKNNDMYGRPWLLKVLDDITEV